MTVPTSTDGAVAAGQFLPRQPPLYLSLIALSACLAGAGRCEAGASQQTNEREARVPAGPSPSPPQHIPDAAPEAEIVITARRWGQVDMPSETELDEAQIRARGARSIGELVGNIAPLIDGTGNEPAILVNGRRIGSPAEIRDYPPEALTRVAILPPEAAARYGYPPGQRVINLELKQKYASWHVDAGVAAPTAGGRRSGEVTARRTAIDGHTRWNAQVAVSDDTPLLKSARHIPIREDLLALLPTLQQAGDEAIDPNGFESVSGAARSLTASAGMTRPLGSFSASLSFNASLNRNRQLLGMPIGSIILPPGSPWVPAAGEAVITSRLLGDGALESRQRSEALGVSASLSGLIRGWQTSFSVLYSHSRSNNVYDRGYDVSAVQRRVDAGDASFDPYGPWPATPLRSDRTRSRAETLSASLNVSRSVLKLPAGEVSTSLAANAGRNRSRFSLTTGASGVSQHDRFGSDQLDGRWTLTIPVTSRALNVLSPLGDMAFDLSGEVATATRTRMRRRWNAGVRWVPLSFLDLRASIGHENAEPTFDQLYSPQVEIVTRMFDFARQEYVQPVRVFGGNPGLEGGSIRSLSLNAMIRPLPDNLATLNFGYRRLVARGSIWSFPALTPDVEAAFPDRVRRDSNGRLLSIDARPINISHDRTESIASGLTLQYTEKPQAPGAASSQPGGFRPWTVSLSINHNWQLTSETVIRPGLPVLDRLRNNGLSRHTVALNLVAGRAGLGATLNGNWSSAAHVRAGGDASAATEFRYAPSILFNLNLFVELDQWVKSKGERKNWASGLRASLDIQNLMNGYRNVSVRSGSTARDYARDEIDPFGRTIRLSLQKQF